MASATRGVCPPRQAVRLHVDSDCLVELLKDLPLILVLAVTKNFVSCDEVADDHFRVGWRRRRDANTALPVVRKADPARDRLAKILGRVIEREASRHALSLVEL